jgi:hypothetical protein
MSLLKSVMVFGVCCLGSPALADGPAASGGPQPIAVFPFTIQDTSGAPAPGQKERLENATKELADTLAATGLYKPVDLSPYAKEIATMQPADECGECWANLAKKAGARFEVLPSVQKVSVLISQMTMWFADVQTMKYSRLVQGQIRGDTAEAYTRGIDFLVHGELMKKKS